MVLPSPPHTLCLFARLFSALTEELMVHCSYSDTPPALTTVPTVPTPHFTGCPSLTRASPGLGSAPGPALVSWSACSLCCVCHLYACPPTCPQMPVCAADSLLEHSCLEDDVFYSCDRDFNVSICLVQTWTPTHPEQKHKGSLLVLHKIFLNLFFCFVCFLFFI